MRKIIVLIIGIALAVGIFYFAAHSKSKDLTSKYLEHASFYGLKDFINDDEIIVENEEEYSHADFQFWGIPDVY